MNPSKIKFSSNSAKGIFKKKVMPVPVKYKSDKPNIEDDAISELTELQVKFREKAKAEKERQEKNTNSDFWSCIVFKTQDQRDRFLQILGISSEDNQYINGHKLIQALEMKIQAIDTKEPGKFKCNKEILNLSLYPNNI